MTDRRSPTPAEAHQGLIDEAATRAVTLALAASREAQKDAVDRALREQRVDGKLHEHEERLDAINGSQVRAAQSLRAVEQKLEGFTRAFEENTAVNRALTKATQESDGARFSKRTFRLGLAGAMATYLTMLATLIASLH